MTLTKDVLEDNLTVPLASALAVANRHAIAVGRNALESRISVTQVLSEDGVKLWRISYGAINAVSRRGGDLIVEVRADNNTLYRVLKGQ
jgi:hypothetical protein